jgi:type III secretion protein U
MAAKDQGADRTEQPTPKRLRDARKEGQVHRSKELTSTALLLLALFALYALAGPFAREVVVLTDSIFSRSAEPFDAIWPKLLQQSAWLIFLASTIALALPAAIAAVVEFLQVGPVLAFKRVKPDLSHVNPAEGLKRIFSMDNLVALTMALVKTVLLVAIAWFVILELLADWTPLPYGQAGDLVAAFWQGAKLIGIWVIVVFFFVSAFDAWYQRFSFIKQLRMSRRDIRQEVKENEGDPLIKSKRRELHQEWARQNQLFSVRQASVVVTNPTHVAVALLYEPGTTELPVVTAKGEDFDAEEIKRVAREAGVPIMENVDLARGLAEQVEVHGYVPEQFFQAVAEVLRWAESVREQREQALR